MKSLWNITYFARVLLLSVIWLSVGGGSGRAGDVTELHVLNATPSEARLQTLDVGSNSRFVWLKPGETVVRYQPEVDVFGAEITVRWNTEQNGSYFTNGGSFDQVMALPNDPGMGTIWLVLPAGDGADYGGWWWSDGKALSKAWWAGMGLGGGIGAVMVVLGALRLARQPIGGL